MFVSIASAVLVIALFITFYVLLGRGVDKLRDTASGGHPPAVVQTTFAEAVTGERTV
jgi:hypothetical protein